MNTLNPRVTPSRLRYLKAVAEHGIYEPRHRLAANHCLGLGWVESVTKMPNGDIVALADMSLDEWCHAENIGQRLTKKGHAVLFQAGLSRG